MATVDGGFDGVEQLVTAEVDESSAMVTALLRRECTNPATDTFGADIAINSPFATPWPIGTGLGTGGSDVVEFYYPITGSALAVRLGFALSAAEVCADDAILTNNGLPGGSSLVLLFPGIPIPTLVGGGMVLLAMLLALGASWRLRRRHGTLGVLLLCIVATGGTIWAAAAITPDGSPADWTGDAVIGTDPADPAPDIVAVFAAHDAINGHLAMRVDATLTVVPDLGCDISLSGNLGFEAPGTPEDTGQDAYEFATLEADTELTLNVIPDGNIDPEIYLYAPGAVGFGATNLLTGNPFGFNSAGLAGIENAVITVGPVGTYTFAIEDSRTPLSQVAGAYTATIVGDKALGAAVQTEDDGPESD